MKVYILLNYKLSSCKRPEKQTNKNQPKKKQTLLSTADTKYAITEFLYFPELDYLLLALPLIVLPSMFFKVIKMASVILANYCFLYRRHFCSELHNRNICEFLHTSLVFRNAR